MRMTDEARRDDTQRPARSGTWYPPYGGRDDGHPAHDRYKASRTSISAGAAGHRRQRRARGGETARPIAGGADAVDGAGAHGPRRPVRVPFPSVSGFISTMIGMSG